MTPRLIGISESVSGWTFYLDEQVTSIGRHWSNDIELNDPRISRHHCLIRREDQEYIIEDLDSTNGVYVNGLRVKRSALADGTLINISKTRLLFWLQELDELIAPNLSQVEYASNGDHMTLDIKE